LSHLVSTHKQIAEKIEQQEAGALLFPIDFRGCGSAEAIKMSLSRHAESGILTRLGNGIYLKNKRKSKAKIPSMEAIASAIAKKEHVRIRLSGLYALYKIGLLDKEPDSLTYITDGEPRNIKIGNKRLLFKSTTAKKLSLSHGISGLLILGLEDLGKDQITSAIENQITKHLTQIDSNLLSSDLRLAPAWIYNLIYKLQQKVI
jgi:hypothetical protein